jgi:quercetin dioxygenase-like cupin family protein
VIKKGDVVKINPNAKHWRGASPDSWLVHVAISMGDVQWLGPVKDKEYNNLDK